MTDQQHIFEQIEDYLRGRMSEEEKISFEQQLMTDKSLAAQLDEAKATDEAIHFANLAELKKTIGEDIKKIKYPSRGKNISYWIIGSVILIAASGGFYLFNENSEDKTIITTSRNNDVLSQTSTKEQNKIQTEKEVSSSPKKNSPGSISSSEEPIKSESKNNDPSQVTETSTPEKTDQAVKGKEDPLTSPVNNNSDDKKTNAGSPEEKTVCNTNFNIATEPSCKHKETGSITITADGGKEFTFQVDHSTSKGSKGIFLHLPPGEHSVLVSYNKECTFAKTVKIEEKWCALNQPFSFNPDYHEKWELRYEEGAEGKFIIYDRSGKEVYKNNFGSGNEHWNGTDLNGNVVPIGTYAAVLYYSDGRKEKVDITIVR